MYYERTPWVIRSHNMVDFRKSDLYGRRELNTLKCLVFCCATACSPETDRSVGETCSGLFLALHLNPEFRVICSSGKSKTIQTTLRYKPGAFPSLWEARETQMEAAIEEYLFLTSVCMREDRQIQLTFIYKRIVVLVAVHSGRTL
jgi:hypothetical protein